MHNLTNIRSFNKNPILHFNIRKFSRKKRKIIFLFLMMMSRNTQKTVCGSAARCSAVQRGNAACVVGSVPHTARWDELFYV